VTQQQPRHIGYWLKRVDTQFEKVFEEALVAEGMTRRHWQILDSLRKQPRTDADEEELMAPFWTANDISWVLMRDDLTRRGLIELQDGLLTLTHKGIAWHHELNIRVDRIRRTLVSGISDEDYSSTIAILQKMATNMETFTAA
jgi:hypothetical protein